MIQLSEFFQYSFVLILKRKCLVGASRVRCRESGTLSTIFFYSTPEGRAAEGGTPEGRAVSVTRELDLSLLCRIWLFGRHLVSLAKIAEVWPPFF